MPRGPYSTTGLLFTHTLDNEPQEVFVQRVSTPKEFLLCAMESIKLATCWLEQHVVDKKIKYFDVDRRCFYTKPIGHFVKQRIQKWKQNRAIQPSLFHAYDIHDMEVYFRHSVQYWSQILRTCHILPNHALLEEMKHFQFKVIGNPGGRVYEEARMSFNALGSTA